ALQRPRHAHVAARLDDPAQRVVEGLFVVGAPADLDVGEEAEERAAPVRRVPAVGPLDAPAADSGQPLGETPEPPLPDVVGWRAVGGGPRERLHARRQPLLDPGVLIHRGPREMAHLVDELPVPREVLLGRIGADEDPDARLTALAPRLAARDLAGPAGVDR